MSFNIKHFFLQTFAVDKKASSICFDVIWKKWWALGGAAADFHNIDSHECLWHLTAERRHVELCLGTTHWRVKLCLHSILFRSVQRRKLKQDSWCSKRWLKHMPLDFAEARWRDPRSKWWYAVHTIRLSINNLPPPMWEDLLFNGGMLATKLDQSMQDQITDFIWFHKLDSLLSILKCFEFVVEHELG